MVQDFSHTDVNLANTFDRRWNFLNLGYSLVAVLIAALLVGFVTGGLADVLANSVAKKRGTRVPENQLINLILPGILGILGTILFGIAGSDPQKYHWIVFLLGLGFMAFGFLGTSAIGTVYVLECYPHLAGPALVSIASFRFIIAFLLTLYVATPNSFLYETVANDFLVTESTSFSGTDMPSPSLESTVRSLQVSCFCYP
jgi:hypothetical protein